MCAGVGVVVSYLHLPVSQVAYQHWYEGWPDTYLYELLDGSWSWRSKAEAQSSIEAMTAEQVLLLSSSLNILSIRLTIMCSVLVPFWFPYCALSRFGEISSIIHCFRMPSNTRLNSLVRDIFLSSFNVVGFLTFSAGTTHSCFQGLG